jgi:ubiquinone/menaquinone biosynthesis C-methylase UbiE
MTTIERPEDLRRYYQDQGVATGYMDLRTTQPLNGVLHQRQVAFLNAALARYAPATVLEIACGPGRLTTAMRGVRRGVAVDSSPAMLATALGRISPAAGAWTFLRTDAFVLPFRAGAFDAVYTLRFIRHFHDAERARLYAEVRRVLRPHGLFMVDALNRDVSYPYRVKRGLENYPIYDALYRRGEIVTEIEGAGFEVVLVAPMIRHAPVQRALNRLRRLRLDAVARAVIGALEYLPPTRPSGWMLLCRKTA